MLRPDASQTNGEVRFIRHFWIDPGNFLLAITLPLFLASGLVAASVVQSSKSYFFLNGKYLFLGAMSVLVIAAGCKVGTQMAGSRLANRRSFDLANYDRAMVGLLLVTLIAHVLYTSSILSDPALVKAVLAGERGASFQAKEAVVRIPGITTLTHLSNLVYCMAAVRLVFHGRLSPHPLTTFLLVVLGVLVVAHAILGSERLVLLENAFAFALPLLSFDRRFRKVGALAPFIGGILVFLLFAYGEYTRSWSANSHRYDSFWGYVFERLLAYIAIASNTGAGFLEKMPAAGPHMTAVSLVRAPVIGTGNEYGQIYFDLYGDREFNNPSGIFAPLIDYGQALGLVFGFAAGIVSGWIYGLYRRVHPVALLLFPIMFVGFADITQIWYWGGPRMLPQLLFLALVAIYATRLKVSRVPAIG